MALIGSGCVAIWHDVAAEGREVFYAWHNCEHMPERVDIPGFLRGRRYIALEADLEFFNLYEAETPEVVTGSDYLERLNNPTPWTRSTVVHFQRVARSISRVSASLGRGQGGLAATWRYDVPVAAAARHIEVLCREVLADLVQQGQITGAHILQADIEASTVDTTERAVRNEQNRVPRWILIVEGSDDAATFSALCKTKLSDNVLSSTGTEGAVEFGLYQLQVTILPSD